MSQSPNRYQGEYDDVQFQQPAGGSFLNSPGRPMPSGARAVQMYDGGSDTEQYQADMTKAIGRDTMGVLASSMGGMALGSIVKPLAVPARALGATGTVAYGGSPHTAAMDSRNMRNKIINARGVDRARSYKMSEHHLALALAVNAVVACRRQGLPLHSRVKASSARLSLQAGQFEKLCARFVDVSELPKTDLRRLALQKDRAWVPSDDIDRLMGFHATAAPSGTSGVAGVGFTPAGPLSAADVEAEVSRYNRPKPMQGMLSPPEDLLGRASLDDVVDNAIYAGERASPTAGGHGLRRELSIPTADGTQKTLRVIHASDPAPAPPARGLMDKLRGIGTEAIHGQGKRRFGGPLGLALKTTAGVGSVLAAGSLYSKARSGIQRRGADGRFTSAMELLDNDATSSLYMEDAARRAQGHFDPDLRRAKFREAFTLVDKYAPTVAKDPQLLATYMAKLTPDIGRTLQGDEIVKRVDELSRLEASLRKNTPSLVQDAAPALLSQFLGG